MSDVRSWMILILALMIAVSVSTASPEKDLSTPGLNNYENDPVPEPTYEPSDYPTITVEPTIGDQYGWIVIQSEPSGATVLFDGSMQGVTPLQVQVMSTASPFHQIYLSMDGYQDWSTSLTENPAPGGTIPIHADLVPYGPTETPTIPPTLTIPPTYTPTPTPTIIGNDFGWVSIDSIPDGAELTFDGSFQGSCPALVKVFTTETPSHQILVRMPGYYDYISSLTRNPGSGETIQVTASLIPKAQYGSIRVTSTPFQCIAIIDGGNQDLTPCTFYDLTPGMHMIKVIKEGYQPYSTQVQVHSGSETQVSARLNQVVSTGTLYISSTPAGADILVDGIFQGQTPGTVSGSAGTHELILKLAGFQARKSSVTVNAGQQSTISEDLIPQETRYGAIRITSIPGGAATFLNNDYHGQTPGTGYLDIPNLLPGTYSLSVTHPQNQDYHGTVVVTAGQVTTVQVALQEAIQPAAINGTLFVSSNPSGADLFLDNLFKGITPVTIPSVSPGNHTITLQLPDYLDAVRPVVINAGSSTDLLIDMIPVPPPSPEETETPVPTPVNPHMPGEIQIVFIIAIIIICALIAALVYLKFKHIHQ